MIKANEIRIGNIVEKSIKSGNGRKLIAEIGCQDIVRIFENTGNFNYEPIPLTEEWLIRFGFEKALNGYWCQQDLFNVKISKFDVIEIYLRGSDTDLAFCGIQYVHQLMNLYHSLTQTELTLSNP